MIREVTATSAGLTTAVTAYSIGDQMGTLLSFPGAVLHPGSSGMILAAHVYDDSGVLGAFDLALFSNTVTPAADNAAATFSTADGQATEGVLSFLAANLPVAGKVMGTLLPVSGGQPFSLANPVTGAPGTTLFGAMIARSANAVFAAGATSVRIKLLIDAGAGGS